MHEQMIINNADTKLYQPDAKIMLYSTSFDASGLCTLLAEDHNIHTTSHNDFAQVIAGLRQQSYDLCILINIDGTETIKQLRQIYTAAQLPIIVIQEHDQQQLRHAILQSSVNDYLSEITDLAEIALRIMNKLREVRVYKHELVSYAANKKDLSTQLDILISNGLIMSVERDRTKVLHHILHACQAMLNCSAGTLYLISEHNTLEFSLRTRHDELPQIEIPLYDAGKPNERYVSTYVALNNKTVIIDDIAQETRFDFSGTRDFHSNCEFKAVSMLTIPLAPRNGEVIGVLQFINALDPDSGAIIPFRRDLTTLVEAFTAQAAVALDNVHLVEEQKHLIESMIRVIAVAIDAKSLYTGRHCERVPNLAMMLAQAVCAVESGPLADFNFASQDEWQEFRFGAWLHDCGKVTTPEYVIDKATKLETIYNRIHEVRMRFEVLLRDAEIESLQAQLRGESPDITRMRFQQRKEQLMQDFAFLAECNVGCEAMNPASIERINSIAQQTWWRHFDDRLGLSIGEHLLYQNEPDRDLPVPEQLLADKKHHIIPRTDVKIANPEYGFQMDIPEYLYNYGEIYNLSVIYGTLNKEERFKINEHVMQSIIMLEKMAFPKNLQRVPEYAGTHHETLDGRGYPRKLTENELSIPARIMAIADVFEALTATDRPYKPAKKLSEALNILYQMKQDRHIDADIFDLFLTSGVCQLFAERYLAAEQIDTVDISVYLQR